MSFQGKDSASCIKVKITKYNEKDVKRSYYKKHSRDFFSAFKVEGPLCYCHDIEEPFRTLAIVHIVDE